MRNDERYRQKPMSNQLEIFGLGADGEQDMAEARTWIGEHPRAWDFMVEQATRLSRKATSRSTTSSTWCATSCTSA